MNVGKKIMPMLLLMLVLFAVFCAAWAEGGGILDDTRIPDMTFRKALDVRYGDANHYVNFLRTDIDVSDSGISDLTGIELFTNLLKLDCSGNNLEIMDLSQNAKLYSLDCRDNPLAVLNTGELENLEILYCSGDRLTTLHLPTKKDKLKILNISNSKIPTLDVRGFNGLESVTCVNGSLTSLCAAGCQNLDEVTCSGSPLRVLDVSECSKLSYIAVDDCSFETLSLNSLDELYSLKCNRNPMTSLNVSVCPVLESIDCSCCELEILSIISCGSLNQLQCSDNHLTNMNNITTLTNLDCSNNRLTELGAFPGLLELNCCNNLMTTLNVPVGLWTLNCSNNLLTALNLSQCKELTYVMCSSNLLTTLSVTGAEALDTLIAHNNQLTTLNIDGTGFDMADWAGEAEYEGFTVRTWNFDLIFDPTVSLMRGDTVIYTPNPDEMPLPTLFLPHDLITIEDDAFNGIAAEAVLIPETVTTINGDPFADSSVRYIYGYVGSAAEDFAQGRYTFVPVEDTD